MMDLKDFNHTHDHTPEERMKGLVEQLDAYIAQYHGGRVEFCSFDGKIVKVRMGGACEQCPLQPATLRGWVEGTIKQFFSEVEKVENCE